MRITCIGGGPAGLYFALLMKQHDPANQVTLLERNRADDTFGWGVVFSDQTLGALQRADPKTAAQILESFNHWDDIEVFFKGRSVRSSGHGFCGIGRQPAAQHPAGPLRRTRRADALRDRLRRRRADSTPT